MAAVPYIGSKISLISKSDLRYEGTLFTIDPANSTVSLSNVLCFGSEDRLPEVIPSSETVYPFLIFKGADIKNLYVIEDVESAPQPPPPNDPAIVGTTAPAQSPNAAVIAAAKAKSDAEKADKLLASQLAKTSITGHAEPPLSHPAGYPPKPRIPPSVYGYQPQGLVYPPYAGTYNPAYAMYPPNMPYQSMPYPANTAAPPDFRPPPTSNASQAEFRPPPATVKFTQQPAPSQSQNRPARSLQQNQPAPLNGNKPNVQPLPPQTPAKASRPATTNDGYSGPGTARYLESRRFKSAVVKNADSSVKVDETVIETEFDFQSSNARFDKESYIRDQASPRDAQEPVNPDAVDSVDPSPKSIQSVPKKYDKASSFFDDISLDRDERGRRENRRGQNEETFGTMAAGYTASNYRRNFNRNRRGNQSRRNNTDGMAAPPQSPIRRVRQQSPRSRSSPRNSGRGRRGGRHNQSGTPPDQNNRPRNAKRSTRQPTDDNNAASV